ncbi:DUF4232 domain-containing protein [Nocardia sp. JW2]|uniref:DUF4232 domain-containing protein n=1 Tax=Nocardia sp. JW2 TaxID=3450738 RepID=UPI003F43C1D0
MVVAVGIGSACSAADETGGAPTHTPTVAAPSNQSCTNSALHAHLAPPPEKASRQATQQILLTNVSTGHCLLTGFPDVSLIGTAHHPDRGTTTEQYRWPLQHVAGEAPTVPVPPNGEVRVPIVYLAPREGSASLTTTTIELTLPGAATPVVIPWASNVSLQDAATRPGTYSGAFEGVR